ncbi:RidA family protein [Candidatus Enterococcus ferrettii]|uniref:RidA family protein n=1 Tax=Candidatus Enterococcus ferrettii TaxID=2815324 RepID=A0ABV0ESC8_9ENTE|nr:Rid family hydrolase [Enterococcus sp. 665A]MBO1338890.1 hypothetical protein [Enterococcus sp. 665A]
MKPFSAYRILNKAAHVSGQLPINSKGEIDNTLSVYEQVMTELNQIESIAKELSVGRNEFIKTNVFITDLSKLNQVNDAFNAFFHDQKPARSAFEVASLVGNVTVEIDAIIDLDKK